MDSHLENEKEKNVDQLLQLKFEIAEKDKIINELKEKLKKLKEIIYIQTQMNITPIIPK